MKDFVSNLIYEILPFWWLLAGSNNFWFEISFEVYSGVCGLLALIWSFCTVLFFHELSELRLIYRNWLGSLVSLETLLRLFADTTFVSITALRSCWQNFCSILLCKLCLSTVLEVRANLLYKYLRRMKLWYFYFTYFRKNIL